MAKSRSVGVNILIAGDAKGAVGAFRQVKGEMVGLDGAVKQVQTSVATLAGLYAGAKFFTGSADAAAALIEQQNSANHLFKESIGIITDLGATSASSLGLSQRAAIQAANGYGMLFQGVGIAGQGAAEMSADLVKLGSDLSAFTDLPLDQALGALNSALTGQMVPLKAFGIVLNDATVKQKALEMGLYSGAGALDQSARMLATYELVMEKAGPAHDAYEREQSGLANQQKNLTAMWEDARAKLGNELIPIMSKGTAVAAAMVGAWAAIPGPVQSTALALAGVAFMAPKLYRGFQSVTDAATMFRLGLMGVTEKGAGASNMMGGLINRVGGLQVATGLAAGALGVMAAGWMIWQEQAAEARQAAAEFEAAVKGIREEVEATGDTLATVFTEKQLLEWSTENKDLLDKWGVSVANLRAAILGTDQEWDQFITNFVRKHDIGVEKVGDDLFYTGPGIVLLDQMTKQRDLYVASAKSIDDFRAQKDSLNITEEESADATEKTTKAVKEQESAVEKLNKVVKQRADSARELWDLQDAATDASADTAKARVELAAATKEAAEGGRELADAERAIVDAQRGVVESHQAVAEAQRGVVDAHHGVAEAQREALGAQAELNEERRLAVVRLMELHQASIEASTAEAGAQLALERARKEAERSRASGDDDLKRRESAHKVREAQDALRGSTLDAHKAADEYGRSRAAGVEGDERVIEARGRIRDANERVVESEQRVVEAHRRVVESEQRVVDAADRVGEAQRRRTEVVESAKSREKDATERLEKAIFDEAKAAGELKTKTDGVTAGIEEQLKVLERYASDVGPGSSIYGRIEAFRALIAGDVLGVGHGVAAGTSSLAWAEHSMAGRVGSAPSIQIYGSDVETLRRARELVDGRSDSKWRGGS